MTRFAAGNVSTTKIDGSGPLSAATGPSWSEEAAEPEIVISVLNLFDSDEEEEGCSDGADENSEASNKLIIREMGTDDFDSLSVTDSGVFSDNDACSSGRSSPISCKEGMGGRDDRFAILTYDQVRRIDTVLNEVVALEGRGNFPAIEVKLKDLLSAVKEKLVKEGLKIRDIRLNGGAASHALNPEPEPCFVCGLSYQSTGEDSLTCSCHVTYDNSAPAANTDSNVTKTSTTGVSTFPFFVQNSTSSSTSSASVAATGQGLIKSNASFPYNDIDLIFGIELSTAKHFDRVKTAVLDVILDLLPPQVSRTRMSSCALKEAYVSKMVKVCDGDRWSLIALGNCQSNSFTPPSTPSADSSTAEQKGNRSCSVELKFVDTMRRQYEFSVDSFQVILDSLLLFYKCATVPMTARFFPTVIGESVYGDFSEALFHLHHGLIATHNPEEIRGGGLLKFCNLIVRGYRPADVHSITPLQVSMRYMCSRFFIDFPEIDQQEVKLRTFVANHMSGVSGRLRYAFLVTLHNVVDRSTVCLMGHERRLTLQLIQRLAYQLYASDFQAGRCGGNVYPATCYYMPPTYNHLPNKASSTNNGGKQKKILISNSQTTTSTPHHQNVRTGTTTTTPQQSKGLLPHH